MKKRVMLSIMARQNYVDQEPDSMGFFTEGTMEFQDGGWNISYEESDLTGMDGVTTIFRVEAGKVTLRRCGKLQSLMVFQQGVPHESLYQMEFGALLMRVCAKRLQFDLTPEGGFVDLVYGIEIENTEAGEVDYHLDIRAME